MATLHSTTKPLMLVIPNLSDLVVHFELFLWSRVVVWIRTLAIFEQLSICGFEKTLNLELLHLRFERLYLESQMLQPCMALPSEFLQVRSQVGILHLTKPKLCRQRMIFTICNRRMLYSSCIREAGHSEVILVGTAHVCLLER